MSDAIKRIFAHNRALLLVAALALSAVGVVAVSAQGGAPPDGQARAMGGFLGITVEDGDGGALVAEVLPGSSAEAAGVQAGDLITAINGEMVADAAALVEAVSAFAPEDTLTLSVQRDGEPLEIEAVLGVRPAAGFGFRMPEDTFGRGSDGRGGIFRFQFNMDGTMLSIDGSGVTIEVLPEDSALAAAGLQAGDVIVGVDGEDISAADLLRFLLDSDAETITLLVERGEETVMVEIAAETLRAVLPMGMDFNFEGMPFGFLIPDGRRGGDGRGDDGRGGMRSAPFVGNGRLGVAFVMLDAQVAAERGVEQTEGALVLEVAQGSPAALAGVQVDDVITAVNGEPVDAERTLRDRLFAYEPDDTVSLTVVRADETITLDATLGQPQMSAMMLPGMGMPGMGMPGMGMPGFMVPLPDGGMFLHPPVDGMDGDLFIHPPIEATPVQPNL